jgi:L-asparaginase
MNLKKIMVMFTGGTIGSRKSERSMDVDHSTAYELIQLYESSTHKREIEIETSQPLNILSENLVPEDWMILIRQLKNIDYSLYQGIIITHGTDTLPFTAAALSFACNDIPIPLILIASNYPLNDSRGKGLHNFSHAVDFIEEHPIPGVFVIFENNLREAVVHLGTRLTQSDPFTDEYDSTYSAPFGFMENRRLKYNIHELNPTMDKVQKQQNTYILNKSQLSFSSELLYIKPHSGLNYRFFDFSIHKPKAILHDLYHSGTACTRKSDVFQSSSLEFLAYCNQHNVKVYMAPFKNKSGDLYASSIQFIEAGAIPLENISVESALVKLMLAYGTYQEHQQVLQFLNETCLFFEIHQKA